MLGSSQFAKGMHAEREVILSGAATARAVLIEKRETPLPNKTAHPRQRSDFLKKRGKLQYDPQKAAQWEREKKKLEREDHKR